MDIPTTRIPSRKEFLGEKMVGRKCALEDPPSKC